MITSTQLQATTNQPNVPRPAADDAIADSEDLLIEFFDFFDQTVDDVFAYIKHRTRVLEVAEDVTLKLYFSLLQRKRFFWWRSVVDIPALFSMADKAIASVGQWEEAAAGDLYMKDIAQSMPVDNAEDCAEQARGFIRALKRLSIREQKMLVIRYFLHWTSKKTAKAFKLKTDIVEQAYDFALQHMKEECGKEDVLSQLQLDDVLRHMHGELLDTTQKANMRVAILEQFRKAQMSSLRYVMPVAALLLVMTSAIGGIGYVSVDPVSTQRSVRTLAAVEALLVNEEREILNTLARATDTARGITASYVRDDLTDIALDLSGPAIDMQLALEYNVYTMMRSLSVQAVLSMLLEGAVAMIW